MSFISTHLKYEITNTLIVKCRFSFKKIIHFNVQFIYVKSYNILTQIPSKLYKIDFYYNYTKAVNMIFV